MSEPFAKDVELPALATTKTRNMLYLAVHLGSRGLKTYHAINEKGLTPKIVGNISKWKQAKTCDLELPYYHTKLEVSPEEWKTINSCVKCKEGSSEADSLIASLKKESIMSEIIPHLKHKENLSAESLSSLYLSLFQPTFENLLTNNLPKEKNDTKRKIFEIRESEKYKNLKPNPFILEKIFDNVQ